MDHKQAIADVERRTFEARSNVAKVCERANIAPQSWSRAKKRGRISPITLGAMERAISEIEAEHAALGAAVAKDEAARRRASI